MRNKVYERAIKARVIKKFVEENSRAPNEEELRELLKQYEREFPGVERVGFSSYEVYRPNRKDTSSADSENMARKAIFDDLMVGATSLKRLERRLENSHKAFTSTAMRTSRQLSSLESRLDNLLLLNSNVDVFVYGVEEEFSVQDKVDFSSSSVSVESGWVTMGRAGYGGIDMADVKISATISAERPTLSVRYTDSIDTIRYDDGGFWEAIITTSYRDGRVTVVIDLELPEPADINDLKLSTNPTATNSTCKCTVLVSLDGLSYKGIEPAETALRAGENQINIGVPGVRKVRLLLSKDRSDDTTFNQRQFIYLFSIDSINLILDGYTNDLESILYCGPYELVDEYGDDFKFTKAKLDFCGVVPSGTGISFFLSQDGTTWEAAGTSNDTLSVVNFGNGDRSGTYGYVDAALAETALVEEAPAGLEIDTAHDALINLYVTAAEASKVNLRNISVKRNLIGTHEVYDVSAGWKFDPITGEYSTTIYVDSDRGRWIDLGSSSAKLNSRVVSGTIFLPSGYSVFATQDSNWYEVAAGITTVTALRGADPIYPYNHKLLVEGYRYPTNFDGERIYTSAGEVFGTLMRYVPPELFALSNNDLSVYTIDDYEGNLYFRVKVLRSDATWWDETFDIDYYTQKASTNNLYVKAILSTTDARLSPKLDSFRVRVI